MRQLDFHNLKIRFFVKSPRVREKIACSPLNPVLFLQIYRFFSVSERLGKPRFHLYKSNLFPVTSNQINFPVRTPIVSAQNPIAMPHQHLFRKQFPCRSDFFFIHFHFSFCYEFHFYFNIRFKKLQTIQSLRQFALKTSSFKNRF